MAERRTIGQILMSLGRISEEEVAQALEYQRDQGGYFGEALLACQIVSAEELEWGLASPRRMRELCASLSALGSDWFWLTTAVTSG
jgi:hypothetical protein